MVTKTFTFFARLILNLALISLLIFGATGQVSAAGSIIRVKWNASGANNGASWADAYTDLQVAIGVAISGDQIWVAKGTYLPTSSTDRAISFNLKNGVAIYGGFAGNETLLGKRNPTLNLTILNGDIGIVGNQGDNSYHVVRGSYTSNTAALDGFKIVGGYGYGDTNYGGGIFNDNGSPTLKNLIISGNGAYWGGGTGNVNGSNPKLINVTFSGNFAAGGVGVGGGMANNGSSPTLTNVTFSGNSGWYGGAMSNNTGSNPTLKNVTFNGNIAVSAGDGMYNDSSNPHIYNSIFWGDGAVEILNASSTPTIANSIVAGGCPSGSACTGVLNKNPILGPLQNNGGFTQTMALGLNSPAIDVGKNLTCASTDQRGVKRPQGDACDIGAFEVKVMSFASRSAEDGWVLESSETSGQGGSLNSNSTTFLVGDDSSNRQYRGILSFNTSALPNTAKIVRVALKVKKSTVVGTNPFTTYQGLLADIRTPYFGTALLIAANDFQASASKASIGTFEATPISGWYKVKLNSAAFPYVSKTATTQFRLRFKLDDDNDHGADYAAFYSGDTGAAANRPTLRVYYLP